jgi:PAS domain S-box-containing protein
VVKALNNAIHQENLMRRLLLILPIILFFTAIHPAAAQTDKPTFAPGAHLRFEHLTLDDGLSQNAGLALLQDSQGYLWIGTQDGLNRYNGYTITQFKHDPDNPQSLSHNSVIALYEDRDGFLWVGTWGGGLNRYDPATQQFTRYTPDPDNPDSLSHPIVTDIFQDEQDVYWVATLGGLERFDPVTAVFTHFRHDSDDSASLSSDALSVILPAANGKLWVGTGAFNTPGAGLNLFDPATGTAQRLEKTGDCLASPNIADLQPAPNDALWIAYGGYGVSGGGLDRYNLKTGDCAHFDNAQTFGNQITDNNLADLAFDRDGALWVASWSGGLWRMAPDGQFTGIHHNPADPESLSSDNTFTILPDRSGIIWVGTLSAGINKLNLDTLQFRTYRHDPANPKSLPSNHVSSFAETSDGMIWLGSIENGLVRFDPASGEFTPFRHDPANPNSISGDMVLTLYADPDDTLWAGTLGSGLNHFDPRTQTFTRYQNDPADSGSLLENQVTNLIRDRAGRLWVGTFAGLARLETGATGFVNYPMPAAPVSLGLVGDELWTGTWGGGLYRLDLSDPASLDPAQAAFSTLTHDSANPNSLSNNEVWTILQNPDGMVWIGTISGLNRYDPQTGQFKTYTAKNGLPNASIMGILRDEQGFLWLTTNHGVVRFDPHAETFAVYEKSDGLQGNEFNSNAYFQAKSGDFYVGGVSGFSVFNPLVLRQNELPPPVVITDFSVFNSPQPFNPTETIRLNYDQNFISFEFAALDFHDPRRNQYAYKLEGFDKDWVQAGTRNYASYTNLPGGDYTFRVRAANSDGVWNESGATLKLAVTPPFWQTWPFQLGLFLGVVSLLTVGFQWRVRAVREQNAQLQKMVDEQKRVEVELRESQARFRAMFENAAVGVSLMTLDRRIVQINPKVTEITGYTSEEIAVINPSDMVLEPDRFLDRDLFRELVAGKRDQYLMEKRYIRKNGSIFWGRINFALVRSEKEEPLYIVAIIEDITEEKESGRILAESEARFRALYDSAEMGIVLVDLGQDGHQPLDETRFNLLVANQQLNPAMQRMFGYTADELQQISISDLIHPDDLGIDRQEFRQLLTGEIESFHSEKRFVRKDGSVFWGRLTDSLARAADGTPRMVIGIIEDITEEKLSAERLAAQESAHRQQLEQRIAERTEELNLANERLREKAAQDAVTAERTRLARDLHDAVTQTLFSTTLIADVLPDIWALNPEEGRRRLEEIRQMTRGALAEMRTLLVELRPNALVEVPLPTLLRQLTEALSGRSRINIQLSAEGERKLPADVQVGLYRLAQEALNNIVKHAKANQAIVTLRCSDETVRLTVADNGMGFDPTAVTADHLGLKIMRERAEAIGAKLTIYSEPDEGTQISVIWQ